MPLEKSELIRVTQTLVVAVVTFLLGTTALLVKESYNLDIAIRTEAMNATNAMQEYNRITESDNRIFKRLLKIWKAESARTKSIGGVQSHVRDAKELNGVRELINANHTAVIEDLAIARGIAENASPATLPSIKLVLDSLKTENEVWEAALQYTDKLQKNRHDQSIKKQVKRLESSIADFHTNILAAIESTTIIADKLQVRQANAADDFKSRINLVESYANSFKRVGYLTLALATVLYLFLLLLLWLWKEQSKQPRKIIRP